MGQAKPAMRFGSTTMVGAVVRGANRAVLSPIVVVTGFHESAVSAAVGSGALIVHNPRPELGNVSSLVAGIDACAEVGGVVVLLSDMPRVSPDVIGELADGMAETGSRVGWVEYCNGRGHPIALARSVFDEVRSLTGSKALWPYLSSVPLGEALIVRTDESRPRDVNTPEDYGRLTRESGPG